MMRARRSIFQIGVLGVALAVQLPTALSHGIVEEEITRLTLLLRDRPADPKLLRQRAERHREHGDLPAARADLLAARAGGDASIDILLPLAQIERESGRLTAAQEAIDRYLKQCPENPFALREKALIHAAAAQWPAAADAWLAVLRNQPSPNAEHFLACAQALSMSVPATDTARSALDVLRRGIIAHPHSIPLQQRAAAACIELGLIAEAELYFASIRHEHPNLHPRLLAAEGALWAEHGDAERSKLAYRKARSALDSLPARRRDLPGFRSLGNGIDLALAKP
jgi:hypothetical protein